MSQWSNSYDTVKDVFSVVSYYRLNPATGAVEDSGRYNDVFSSVFSKKQAMKTPGWHALVKGNAIKPHNPYFISKRIYGGYNRFDGHIRGSYTEYTGSGFPIITRSGLVNRQINSASSAEANLDAIVSECEGIAINRILSDLKDSKANLAQTWAERNQLQRMLGDYTTRLASMYSNLRRGNLKGAAENIGFTVSKRAQTRYRRQWRRAGTHPGAVDSTLSNGVLQLQYGIRPLLSDVQGAAELLAQKLSGEQRRFTRKQYTIPINHRASFSAQRENQFYVPYTVDAQVEGIGNVRVSISLTYSVANEVTHTVAQMGISNPLLLAWELLPWSFVIDWFLPIGNWLSSLDATNGLVFKAGSVATKVDYFYNYSESSVGGRTGNGAMSIGQSYFRRTPLRAFPAPVFPSFKNPVSLEHAVNGIALLQQQLARRK